MIAFVLAGIGVLLALAVLAVIRPRAAMATPRCRSQLTPTTASTSARMAY
jgi:hypothetical protein